MYSEPQLFFLSPNFAVNRVLSNNYIQLLPNTILKHFSSAKKPASSSSTPSQPTRKKPLVMDVPPYNRDPATQARNIRNFYRTLLENYTDYALSDVSEKVCYVEQIRFS